MASLFEIFSKITESFCGFAVLISRRVTRTAGKEESPWITVKVATAVSLRVT